MVWRTWPASTTELEPEVLGYHGNVETPAAYAGTEPDQPAEVLDATGIASPIPLQDLGGNECVPGLARVNVHAGFLGLGFLGLPAALRITFDGATYVDPANSTNSGGEHGGTLNREIKCPSECLPRLASEVTKSF